MNTSTFRIEDSIFNIRDRIVGPAIFLVAAFIVTSGTASLRAEEASHGPLRIDDSITRGLAIVQTAAKNYPSHRDCFSCHHQTLPLLAMKEARDAGYEIDEEVFEATKQHTLESFASRLEKLRQGRGIGGRASTVSYGLWALDIVEHKPDETTTAMVTFLLKDQRDDGRWVPPSNRPPLEESQITATVLSSYYMRQFANDDQRNDIDKAVHKARAWIKSAPLESNEDFVLRLLELRLFFGRYGSVYGERYLDSSAQQQMLELELFHKVAEAQRESGGWSQLPKMKEDAYATGQTLWVLGQTFNNTPFRAKADAVFRNAARFLQETQQEDGSWLVTTRSKPVQVFFDNGDPHGKSQFISVAATSWAVAALARYQQASTDEPKRE